MYHWQTLRMLLRLSAMQVVYRDIRDGSVEKIESRKTRAAGIWLEFRILQQNFLCKLRQKRTESFLNDPMGHCAEDVIQDKWMHDSAVDEWSSE